MITKSPVVDAHANYAFDIVHRNHISALKCDQCPGSSVGYNVTSDAVHIQQATYLTDLQFHLQ